MRAKTINFDELSYAEIIDLQNKLNEDKNKIEARIKELEKLYVQQEICANYDIAKDIENEDIPKKQGELIKVEDKLAEIADFFANIDAKSNMILNDADVELTAAEAQFLEIKYTPIVDEAYEEYKDEEERYSAYANHPLNTDEEIDEYNDVQHDYEVAEKNYNNSLKVLNYAQNCISQDFSKNK